MKRSASQLTQKLAAYEKSTTTGVLSEELGHYSESEDEIDLKNPLQAMQEMLQAKQMQEVRNKWKNNSENVDVKEDFAEERRSELMRFR